MDNRNRNSRTAGWGGNNEEIEETETEELESEKSRTEETSYAGGQENDILCEAIKNLDFSSKECKRSIVSAFC